MEINREKIVIEIAGHIKALKANKGWWENRGRGGWFNHDILEDALSLINELTEENERLEDNLIKQSTENIMLLIERKDIKADTVRKMQELIFDRLDISVEGYSAEEVKSDVRDMVYQIAKEMVEGIE